MCVTISPARRFENVPDMNRRRIFGPALADVDQERDLQIVAELSRPRQRLQTLCSQGAAGSHDLYADDDVSIRLHGFSILSSSMRRGSARML